MAADPLHAAFDRFLSDRDEAALLAAIREHGGRPPPKGVDYPAAHRICDVRLGGPAFRVVRVIDLDGHTTRLYIYPTESPDIPQPGVPLRLQGNALLRWVKDELESPADDRIDWGRYDPSLGDDA